MQCYPIMTRDCVILLCIELMKSLAYIFKHAVINARAITRSQFSIFYTHLKWLVQQMFIIKRGRNMGPFLTPIHSRKTIQTKRKHCEDCLLSD